MNPIQEAVTEFHDATGGRWNLDNQKSRELRAKLIMEEAVETVAALGFHVHAEINDPACAPRRNVGVYEKLYHKMNTLDFIDGICDTMYVLAGGAVNLDIDIQRHFDEVHAANMRKLSGPKRSDGKQLKPEGWVGPDHQRILELYLPVSEQQAYEPYKSRDNQDGQCCRTHIPTNQPSGAR